MTSPVCRGIFSQIRADETTIRTMLRAIPMKRGVNDPCPCGSGKKYKKCCLHKGNKQTLSASHPQSTLEEAASIFSVAAKMNTALSQMLKTDPPKPSDIPSELQSIPSQAIALLRTLDSQLTALEALASVEMRRPILHSLVWEPVDDKKPTRFVPREDTAAYLTPQRKAFYDAVVAHVTKKTPHDLETALQMLDTIPLEEQCLFHWMVAARTFCLQELGKKEEALWFNAELLLHNPDERAWHALGPWVLQWMQHHRDSPRYPYVLDTLKQLCATIDSPPIQLVLAAGLCEEGPLLPNEEAVPFYRLALRPEYWPWVSGKPYSQTQNTPIEQRDTNTWLGVFSVGLARMLTYTHQQQDTEQFQLYTKLCHKVPWGQLSPDSCEKVFTILCETFFRIQSLEQVSKLVESFRAWIPRHAIFDFWVGRVCWHNGQIKPATQAFLKALKSPKQLSTSQCSVIAEFFIVQKSPESMRMALDAHQERDSYHYLRLEYWYYTLIEDPQTALSWIERFLERYPDNFEHECRRLHTLEQLNRTEQLESELQSRLASSHEPTRQHAHLWLAFLRNNQQRYEEALALLKAIPETPDEQIFLRNPSTHSGFYVLWADVLEQTTPEANIEPYLDLALQISPDVWNLTRLLIHYCRHQRWDDAARLLPQITALGGDGFYTQRAQLHIALHHNNFAEARSILESVGRPSFEEHQALEVWLTGWIQVLNGEEDPCAVLRFTEEHLDAILANPGLREVRRIMIQEITQRYQSLINDHRELEERLGQKHHTEQQQVSELRLQLEQAITKNQRYQEGFQRALRDHQSLQSRMHSLHQQTAQHDPYAAALQKAQEALVAFEQQHASLLTNLSPEARNYLVEAERFWHQTIPKSINDYAPLTVQYARALEREINLKLIDPLVAWTLAQGGKLADFPAVNTVPLKPRQNQLSLGDAIKMIYHRIVYTDNQGTTVIQRNPVSFPEHQNILGPFWSKTISLFGGSVSRARYPSKTADPVTDVPADAPFILDLLEFTQLRNRASHARETASNESSSHILSKQEAERLRHLALGDHVSPGLLARIVQLHRVFFDPPSTEDPA